jgi:hypothetical protein
MTGHVCETISESLGVLLREAHDSLLRRPFYCGPVVDFGRIRRLLEALPLASAEFSVAVNRLANARHYLRDGEYGAARYELRLLLRRLEN